VQEEFILYFLVNMFLQKNYSFMQELRLNIEDISENVSDNFLGNYYRLEALYMLLNGENGEASVRLAEKHYALDDNKWGLGLCYHLLGRIQAEVATDHFAKAL